jgi:hypothetical protein
MRSSCLAGGCFVAFDVAAGFPGSSDGDARLDGDLVTGYPESLGHLSDRDVVKDLKNSLVPKGHSGI